MVNEEWQNTNLLVTLTLKNQTSNKKSDTMRDFLKVKIRHQVINLSRQGSVQEEANLSPAKDNN